MLRTFFRQFTEQNIVQQNLRTPIFALDPDKITVIARPDEFYSKLKELASTARSRISISSLYLGTTNLERDLLSSIVTSQETNPSLKIRFLLDYNRSNRETLSLEDGKRLGKSSKYLLLPLVQQNNAKVSFFLTQRLGGWKQFIQRRQEWNELCALHHMKLYIFDDDLIISGANLSDLYFKQRQDRYILIKDAKHLCDYFDQVIKTVSKFSMKLNSDGQFSLHKDWKFDPRLGGNRHRSMFDQSARQLIEKMNEEFLKSMGQKDENSEFKIDSRNTFAVPLLNIASIGHSDEEKFTVDFFKNLPEMSELHIASGYFNLTEKYQTLLAGSKRANSILMASEEANGFYNGRGLLKFVPFVYTTYLRSFLRKLDKYKSNSVDSLDSVDSPRTRIWYYNRPEWSFHGKGIWFYAPKFFMTFVGSSNFGYRSAERDNEAQLVLVTKDRQLTEQFRAEHTAMVKDSREILDGRTDLPEVPLWVRCYARVFRSYF